MSNLEQSARAYVQGQPLAGQDGYRFILLDVTSQAKVYKQKLRDFFRQSMPMTPRGGEFEVEIVVSLNPSFPAIDLDNVAKAILDGLKGHIFQDDAQVMRLLVQKQWADDEAVEVKVWRRD